MIKTIKVKRAKTLSGIIAYISENGIKGRTFESNFENMVRVDYSGQITTAGKFYNDIFIAEEEEEITEDTAFDSLIEVTVDGDYIDHGYKISISDVKDTESLRFYALFDKKLELIWEDK